MTRESKQGWPLTSQVRRVRRPIGSDICLSLPMSASIAYALAAANRDAKTLKTIELSHREAVADRSLMPHLMHQACIPNVAYCPIDGKIRAVDALRRRA